MSENNNVLSVENKAQQKEWIKLSENQKEYHYKQWDKPYRSTEKFAEWLEKLGYLNKEDKLNLCDVACGGG